MAIKLTASIDTRNKWNSVFKVLRENDCQIKLACSELMSEGEIMILLDIQSLSYPAYRPLLHELPYFTGFRMSSIA